MAPRFHQPSLTEPRPVHFPHNVCHASFVAQESRQVDWFAGIILRPCLHLPSVATASLMGEEAQVAMPGSRELAVGLRRGRTKKISFTFRSQKTPGRKAQQEISPLTSVNAGGILGSSSIPTREEQLITGWDFVQASTMCMEEFSKFLDKWCRLNKKT